MWTVEQLAKAAKQSPSYIRRQLRDKIIKGEKPQRDWTIPDEEAEKYLTNLKK